MNEFKTLHRYQRAVDNHLLDPIICPNDGSRLYSTAVDLKGENPLPALMCYECTSVVVLGLDAFTQMRNELARLN